MVKKFYTAVLIGAFLLTGLMLSAAPMAVHNEVCNWYDVKSDYYRCTIYVGCMYPVWFTSDDGKVEFPRGFLLDWIKKSDAPDTELHYLREDHFAEVNIIENSEETLIVECVGKFCKGNRSFPGVNAVYRWTFHKNSPEIQLKGTLSFAEGAPRQMCLVMLGSMAFNNMPFDLVQLGDAEPKALRTPGKAPEAFVSKDGAMLLTADGKLRLGVSTPAVVWNNSVNSFYTYVSTEMKMSDRQWNGQQPFVFEMTFKVDGRSNR